MRDLVAWLEGRDRKILFLVNRQMKCPALDKWMPRITHLGGASFTTGFFLLMLFLNDGRDEWAKDGLIALVLSHLLVQWFKRSFYRRRPYMKDRRVHVCSNPLRDSSFPSGHTTAIFAWSTTISLVFPWISPLLYCNDQTAYDTRRQSECRIFFRIPNPLMFQVIHRFCECSGNPINLWGECVRKKGNLHVLHPCE